MTDPALNATKNPLANDYLASNATIPLEYTATFIPTYPATIEVTAPQKNAPVVQKELQSFSTVAYKITHIATINTQQYTYS